MLQILNLIRWRSLFFAAFVLYMTRYFILLPILEINDFQLQISSGNFSLLVIAICLIIAAGNIINDYFDTRIDRISGVRRVVVGSIVSRRTAITLHSVLNVVAMAIILYFSISVGIWKISVLFFVVTGLLWFYSSTYKRFFITGNLIVGILTALIPFGAVIFEIPLLNRAYGEILTATGTNFLYVLKWVAGFSYFIFLNTMMYEINKDIYSIYGDSENRVNSIPVRLGIPATKRVLQGIALLAVISAIVCYFFIFRGDLWIAVYLFVCQIVPYCMYIFGLQEGRSGRKFQLILIRLIMILTVAFSFLLKHFFNLIFE